MNYINIYKEKEPEEIKIILEGIDELSYEAKTALHQFLLEKPEGLEVNNEQLEELKTSYQAEDDDINSLKYLPNLGFKIEGGMNELSLKRTKSARFVDIIGIIVGIALLMVMIPAIGYWQKIISEGVDMLTLVWAIINSIIGVFGLVLFTKALYRFIEYSSFLIQKQGSMITIRKMEDLNRRTYQVDKSDISIETPDGTTLLSFVVNNQKINLLSSSEGRVLQNTLTRLGNLLKE